MLSESYCIDQKRGNDCVTCIIWFIDLFQKISLNKLYILPLFYVLMSWTKSFMSGAKHYYSFMSILKSKTMCDRIPFKSITNHIKRARGGGGCEWHAHNLWGDQESECLTNGWMKPHSIHILTKLCGTYILFHRQVLEHLLCWTQHLITTRRGFSTKFDLSQSES